MKGKRNFGIFLSLLLIVFTASSVLPAVPMLINHQGQLMNNQNKPVADGVFPMRFSLFDAKSNGTRLWNATVGEEQDVSVTNGVYSVQLGTISTLEISVFNAGEVWLEVSIYNAGTAIWETLSPRQQVNSTPYALKAGDTDTLGGMRASQFAVDVHSHSFSEVSGAANDSQVPNNITIDYAASAGTATNTDTVDGEHATAFADTVHGHPFLQVTGSATDSQIPNNITIDNATAAGHATTAGNADTVDGQHASSFMLATTDNWINETGVNSMNGRLDVTSILLGTGWGESIKGTLSSSNLGAGVWGASSGTDARGVYGSATGTNGTGIFGEATGIYSKGVYGLSSGQAGIGVHGDAEGSNGIGIYGTGTNTGWAGLFDNRVKIGPNTFWATGQERGVYFGDGSYLYVGEKDKDDTLTLKATDFYFETGSVGIGTLDPDEKLHVLGNAMVVGDDGWDSSGDEAILGLGSVLGHFYVKGVWGDGLKLGAYGTTDAFVIKQLTGNVGIGTANPSRKLTVKGNFLLESPTTGLAVVELGEGLDYAEGFNVSDYEKISPGSVMRIDPQNPGKLELSSDAYDKKVAGIVAGANNLGSGVRLGSGQFDYDIALAGRVYCNVDTTYDEITPGDLLTTSATPGYAMVVKDHSKAQGAVLGKAMEGLPLGEKGQILVLVTLQ